MKLDMADPKVVDEFVRDLSKAITQDMSEIKETQFDHPGSYVQAYVTFAVNDDPAYAHRMSVLIDKLGRLVVPNEQPWLHVHGVRFAPTEPIRKVLKKEPRYTGDTIAALVVYLESPEVS